MTDAAEPLIVAAIRRRPTGLLHHKPQGVGGTGTTAAGFLREYDNALAAAEARGAQVVLAAVEALADHVREGNTKSIARGKGLWTLSAPWVEGNLRQIIDAARAAGGAAGGGV